MTPTPDSSPTASTADSSPEPGDVELTPPSTGGVCAIHQPNLFPRLSTLAKLFAADTWIVLDNVQFNRRDYQHRTRLAGLTDSAHTQWLTVAAHLPHGRDTLIHDVRTADPTRSRHRLEALTRHYYGDSPHWPDIAPALQHVTSLFDATEAVAAIAEASTTALLRLLDWTGTIVRSSTLKPCDGRSERLADLAHRIDARTYLCGTGGMRYLNPDHFHTHDINVVAFQPPQHGIWAPARTITSLWQLATAGPATVHTELRRQTTTCRQQSTIGIRHQSRRDQYQRVGTSAITSARRVGV